MHRRMLSSIPGLHPLDVSCASPHPHLYNQNNASRHCSKSPGGQNHPSEWGGGGGVQSWEEQQLRTDLRKQPRGGNGAPAGDGGTRGRQSPRSGMPAARAPPWAPTGSPGLPAAHRVRPLAPRPNIPREAGPARRRPHTPRSKPPEAPSTAPPHASASGLGLAASRPSSGFCRAAVERDV